MTPAEARELVAQALESGEYPQGTGCLSRRDGKYCCLGVATEIFMEHNPGIIECATSGDGRNLYKYAQSQGKVVNYSLEETDYLLKVVSDWLGFRTCQGYFGTSDSCSLVHLNDTGKPFSEIAKFFRNPPEGLLE